MADLETERQAVQLLACGFTKKSSEKSIATETDQKDAQPSMPQGLARGLQVDTTPAPSQPRARASEATTPTSSAGVRDRNFPGFTAPSRSRSFRGAFAGTSLHPVLALGWQPRCSVVCNGLRGEFLGGHDRDMFIRCTSPEYASLPPVDISRGGCVMTCSQFERAAGRELSKKWKESIHVVGEGEGSRATLISWIKRQAEKEFGPAVIGKQIWVCWCADAEYYQGTITAYNADNGKHTVQYSPKMAEELHLPVELVSFDPVKPSLPVLSTVPGGGALMRGKGVERAITAPEMLLREAAAVQQELQHAAGGNTAQHLVMPTALAPGTALPAGLIWHQGSINSVTSTFQDDFGPTSPHANIPNTFPGKSGRSRPRKPKSPVSGGGGSGGNSFGGTLHRAGSPLSGLANLDIKSKGQQQQQQQEGLSPLGSPTATVNGVGNIGAFSFYEPYPKRTCSAPASVLLAAAVAAEQAETDNNNGQGLGVHIGSVQQHGSFEFSPPTSGTIPENVATVVVPGSGLKLQPVLMAATTGQDVLGVPTPGGIDVKQQQQQQQQLELLSPLPPPPATTGSITAANGLDAALQWMHSVALFLDDELQCLAAASKTSPPSSPTSTATSREGVSVSGRFQTLLALGRREENWAAGLFEAMAARYKHFATAPVGLARAKMAEYMLAALYESTVQHDLRTGGGDSAGHQAVGSPAGGVNGNIIHQQTKESPFVGAGSTDMVVG